VGADIENAISSLMLSSFSVDLDGNKAPKMICGAKPFIERPGHTMLVAQSSD
jgi:hypothetical protein